MEFEPLEGDRTLVTIAEEGWTGMLRCMKAWLVHGIVLREGLYA